ncbi:MAG TPA: hypothetical protein PL107_08070 [Candidatus Marinimicrobia bacterium]|jgi:hypothetical protein|nr:hypothetical protein [Bacteroidales bacterium]HOV24205.1 hypothetical protein [Candidatus Neomarinimicrobiota bacterium]
MAKLTVEIKQHTPIIHSHYGHPDETLRATEIKSKINHYLREIRINYPRYKVHIDLTSNLLRREPPSKLYLGNMEKNGYKNNKPKVLYRYAYENITVTFNTYFNEGLKENINKVLSKTLCLENFGSRSNKGFGCFTLKNTEIALFEQILRQNIEGTILCWDDNNDIDKVYRHVSNVYQAIKSGFGHGINKSSILSKYFSNKNILWERAEIYKYFFNKKEAGYDIKQKKYVRALLGIPKEITWGDETISISSEDIKRIQSPIIFKIFEINHNQYRVYFWYKLYDKYFDIQNKIFLFKKGEKQFTINVPTFCLIDINNLMEKIYQEYSSKEIRLTKLNEVKDVR